LDRYSFGQRTLLRRRCAPKLLLNVLALVILPLALLVSIVSEYDQTADQKAEHSKPAIELSERAVGHVTALPLLRQQDV
jgi:hypothetical protein